MSLSLKVVVADDEPDMREYFRDILPDLGHEVIGSAANGADLVAMCRALEPDMVISDIRMAGGDGLTAAKQIAAERFIPIILVTAFHDAETLAEASEEHIFAYLVKPVERSHIEAAIAVAWKRFQELEKLRKETTDLRQALEQRKLVERAKGILMKERGMTEDAAFRKLQKLSRDENRKMAEVAQMIILAHKAMQPD